MTENFAYLGRCMDAPLDPFTRVLLIGIIDELLGGQIYPSQTAISAVVTNVHTVALLTGVKVIRDKVVVSMTDGIDEGLEDARITESTSCNLIQHSGKGW